MLIFQSFLNLLIVWNGKTFRRCIRYKFLLYNLSISENIELNKYVIRFSALLALTAVSQARFPPKCPPGCNASQGSPVCGKLDDPGLFSRYKYKTFGNECLLKIENCALFKAQKVRKCRTESFVFFVCLNLSLQAMIRFPIVLALLCVQNRSTWWCLILSGHSKWKGERTIEWFHLKQR